MKLPDTAMSTGTTRRMKMDLAEDKRFQSKTLRRWEQAQYRYRAGEYCQVKETLLELRPLLLRARHFQEWLEATNLLLRIFAEHSLFTEITEIEFEILAYFYFANPDMNLQEISGEAGGGNFAQALIVSHSVNILELHGLISRKIEIPRPLPKHKSRLCYILGICRSYQDNKVEEALSLFSKAVDFAVESGDKTALAYALFGQCMLKTNTGRADQCEKNLGTLETLLECLKIPELRAGAWIMRSQLARKNGLLAEAADFAWRAYELMKQEPNLVLYVRALFAIGQVSVAAKDFEKARLYYELALRSFHAKELPWLATILTKHIAQLPDNSATRFDLSYDPVLGLLRDNQKNSFQLDSQFVVRDLLALFLKSPGHVFGKQELVEQVWRENYDPTVHDNKIYVTIKRLRSILDRAQNLADGKEPSIVRDKHGYFFNPKIRVHFESSDPSQKQINQRGGE